MDKETRDIRRNLNLSKSEAALIDRASLHDVSKRAPWIRAAAVRAAKAMGLNGKGAKR